MANVSSSSSSNSIHAGGAITEYVQMLEEARLAEANGNFSGQANSPTQRATGNGGAHNNASSASSEGGREATSFADAENFEKIYGQETFFCAAFTRKLLEEIGYLDEQFSPGGGEDIDFCVRTQRLGKKLLQIPLFDSQ
jgi:GT2 family glycosyltransferase